MFDSLINSISFAAIDFESAGALHGQTDHPVQIGIAHCNTIQSPPQFWESYISTPTPVLWTASKVHGITTEMLQDAPTFTSLWSSIRQRLDHAVIIGHNPSTERRFLRNFPGHGFGPWIDTLMLAKMCLPGLSDYALGTVADSLKITEQLRPLLPEKNWHNALFDAAASLLIFQKIVSDLHLEHVPLSTLGAAIKS
ncbi:MAG: 3'-5' exonuclease [Akkermansia sp.]